MAHKVVLASCSPYLHSILMRLRHSHQQPVIFLSRINITDLTKLVTFMYTGQVEVEESQIESFLRSAAELQVKGLVAIGGSAAAKKVKPDAKNDASAKNDAKKEIRLVIIDANSNRIEPAKLNKMLNKMYQRLQAGKYQCHDNKCGKAGTGSRQEVLAHLEKHLDLSFPCSVGKQIPDIEFAYYAFKSGK